MRRRIFLGLFKEKGGWGITEHYENPLRLYAPIEKGFWMGKFFYEAHGSRNRRHGIVIKK
jgi:hypothetical protein